jgi:glycosyltransferase involved in cell wall biosynthesis
MGGGQTYLLNLLNFLPDEFELEVFVLAPDCLSLPQKAGIRRISANWMAKNPFTRAVWERLYLPRLVKQLDADVLFCPGGIIGGRVPTPCKSVTMFRNMVPFSPMHRRKYPLGYMRARNWILRRVLLGSMLRADFVICLSEYARTVIEEQARVRLKNAAIIPHGVPASFRKPGIDSFAAPDWLPADGYLLYASTVDHYKAQIEVIQGYALLREKRKTKEKLLLVGAEYPPYGRKVRAEIERLGLQNEVLITGMIPYSMMPAIYQNALVNIFASECENCPNILLEALAAGRPVLSSSYPPMPEFAGTAAVYFDPRAPIQLAEALAATLDDPALMSEMARRAVERSRDFDWHATAKATWLAISEQCRQ